MIRCNINDFGGHLTFQSHDQVSYQLTSFGSRGSAIARIIGHNTRTLQHFATTVKMWVFEENVNGRKLTDIINTEHENIKYLPGYKLPENVVRCCPVLTSHHIIMMLALISLRRVCVWTGCCPSAPGRSSRS